jgi:hypothetical protein
MSKTELKVSASHRSNSSSSLIPAKPKRSADELRYVFRNFRKETRYRNNRTKKKHSVSQTERLFPLGGNPSCILKAQLKFRRQFGRRQSPFFENFYESRISASGESARLGKGILMFKQKRFSPALLERFHRQNRGLGNFEDYIPWHRVGRGDPSSVGRSHLYVWKSRHREMLSDVELDFLWFATLLPNVLDVKEQLKLSLDWGPHEMAAYDLHFASATLPGTLSIALELGIRHPKVHGGGQSAHWIMSTDLVLLLRESDGSRRLLAVSIKPSAVLEQRTRQLLAIERMYWKSRGVVWLLITPELFDAAVGQSLRRYAPWGLGAPTSMEDQVLAASVVKATLGHSTLSDRIGNEDQAKRALWQAVWAGSLTVDLRRGWRPHIPLEILSRKDFIALNPIASWRTSWI